MKNDHVNVPLQMSGKNMGIYLMGRIGCLFVHLLHFLLLGQSTLLFLLLLFGALHFQSRQSATFTLFHLPFPFQFSHPLPLNGLLVNIWLLILIRMMLLAHVRLLPLHLVQSSLFIQRNFSLSISLLHRFNHFGIISSSNLFKTIFTTVSRVN